ncbi:hypothetical protein C8Q75DRAFT_713662, partial [Abortiporus biennis]
CEQKNLCNIYYLMSHSMDGYKFPNLVWLAIGEYKAIVYCQTKKQCLKLALYLKWL